MSLFSYSQTEIKGKLVNCNSCKVTAITDHSKFEPDKNFISSRPDRFGNFVFDLDEEYRPTAVVIEVNAEKLPVYVEPQEQTWLIIQQDAYELNYYFERNLVQENNHLKSYFDQFGWLSNRNKESKWFNQSLVSFPINLYNDYLALPENERVNFLIDLRQQMIEFAGDCSNCSNEYQSFILNYAENASAAYIYSLAAEGDINEADQLLIERVLGSHIFQDADAVNLGFMPHLRSYVKYISSQQNQQPSRFKDYFTFIWQEANQIDTALKNDFLLYLLDEYLKPSNLQSLKPVIHSYIQSLNNIDFIVQVTDIYQSIKQKADGRAAPNFVLEDSDGNLVSLESLEGESVFLAFWSSSCRPCIEGMKKSKENKRYLQDENVKFVYVSTDLTKATWKSNKYVKQAGTNDIHLWIGKSQPELKEYDAFTLPTYYFIDKEGHFVFNFPKSWEAEFVPFVKSF